MLKVSLTYLLEIEDYEGFEEVSEFIGRAILIRKGEIVANVSMEEIEEQGDSLMSYIKKTYNYKADRVGRAISELEWEEE